MIKILHDPVAVGEDGVEVPEGFPTWPFVLFQDLHPLMYQPKKIVVKPESLSNYLEVQTKLAYEHEHRGQQFSFYELTDHWAVGLNFCRPFQKRIGELQLIIDRNLRPRKPATVLISGYTVGQLLQHVPLDKLDVRLYYVTAANNRESEIQVDIFPEFGSDNYQYLSVPGVARLAVYRGCFHSMTEAVLYMGMKVFATTNGKVFCTVEAIQSGWLFSLPYQLEVPVEAANQSKWPLKLFKKQTDYMKLFHRDYNLRTHTEKVLKYRWSRCYCCPNYVYKVQSIAGRPVDFIRNADICETCYSDEVRMMELNIDLSGKWALVTGARVKIGYQLCLRLLRCGARVFGMTRYPHLALANYKKQADYEEFKDRLVLIQCDLINVPYLTSLIKSLKQEIWAIRGREHPVFDIVVNNACHTVAPPKEFYEKARHSELHLQKALKMKPIEQSSSTTTTSNSVMLKNNQEVCYINCQLESGSELEPIVPLDKFGEVAFQFDAKNSWNKSLSELSVEEILNANLINQISPTLIIRELVQELSAEFDPSKNTIIVVNVTSNEGYFRSKDDAHIHTNMAKASLDMLSYSLHGSTSPLNRRYYYSVDPGFVSSVVTEHVPLTPQMGASRIFHPIHECFQQRPLEHYRYKNYRKFHN